MRASPPRVSHVKFDSLSNDSRKNPTTNHILHRLSEKMVEAVQTRAAWQMHNVSVLTMIYSVLMFYVRKEKPSVVAAWLCKRLPQLGPTYVKAAQFVSSREDIFGAELSSGLRDMQNKVPEMSIDVVRGIIDDNPLVARAVSNLEEKPMASASIAQVHIAELHDGRRVVLKVKRPGLQSLIARDLELLRSIVELTRVMGAPEASQAGRVVEDFGKTLLIETDFLNEVENVNAFRQMYGSRTDVVIPAVFGDLCTPDIIVMEYVPSARVFDYRGNKAVLAYRLMALFLGQVLYTGGIVHGDPQPGNIGVTDDDAIVLYDFGNAVTMTDEYRTRLKVAIFSLVTNDGRSALNALEALGVKVLDVTVGVKFVGMYAQYVRKIDYSIFSNGAGRAMPFVLTDRLMRISRVFGILEGVCMQLDDAFDYTSLGAVVWDAFLLDVDFISAKGRWDVGSIMSMDS
jgi:predicted unusual protein kinase regulating ubiquinone biosynthesis (AarF/ABC1/UbiB family)